MEMKKSQQVSGYVLEVESVGTPLLILEKERGIKSDLGFWYKHLGG